MTKKIQRQFKEKNYKGFVIGVLKEEGDNQYQTVVDGSILCYLTPDYDPDETEDRFRKEGEIE